jgi:predicted metal-dependent phosphotriesterase family hydrolase
MLCGELEVTPERVVLGHLGRFPDRVAQHQAALSGAYPAFDGPSRADHATDWRLADQLAALAEAGFGDRLPLGGDTTVPSAPATPYLLRRLRPKLELTLGEPLMAQILTANPARALGAAWLPQE